MQGEAVDLNFPVQWVAGGTGNGGDDRRLAVGEGVEQAGFTDIGRAGDDDPHALAYQATLLRAGQQGFHALHEGTNFGVDGVIGALIDLLFREIEAGFKVGAYPDQFFHQSLKPVGKFTTHCASGEAGRRLGAACDQIGDGFRLGQVDLAIEEGALAEFSGAGQPRAQLDQSA